MIPSLIYEGTIRHRRFTTKPHEFNYSLFMFCFNLSQIEEDFKSIPQVSIEKFNWFTYKRKNYLSEPQIPLDQYVRFLIQKKKGIFPNGKIFLLTNLSCLGYCFNPISIYFIFNEDYNEIDFLIVEVTNTPWGEKHAYILDQPIKLKNSIYQYHFKKELHVSPFMDMNYDYEFNLKIDDNQIIVHMNNYHDGKLDFDATLSLHFVPTESKPAWKIFQKYPLITYKITSAIYWQALKLWLKGNSFHSHPNQNKE